MESGKINFVWNTLQSTVIGAIREFRELDEFLDVTLLSDEQESIKVHSVVLAASSPLLRNLLQVSPELNQNSSTYQLRGVPSLYLNYIIDYIYYGEVLVPVDNVERFLDVASKLQITGLTKDLIERPEISQRIQQPEKAKKHSLDLPHPPRSKKDCSKSVLKSDDKNAAKNLPPNLKTKRINQRFEVHSKEELEQRIDENVDKVNILCMICNDKPHKRLTLSHLRKHVATHFIGVTYTCDFCCKKHWSKEALRVHKYRCRTKLKSIIDKYCAVKHVQKKTENVENEEAGGATFSDQLGQGRQPI